MFKISEKKAHQTLYRNLCWCATTSTHFVFPYIAKRGMCPTADISSPAAHIYIFFSHFGTYWAHSEK